MTGTGAARRRWTAPLALAAVVLIGGVLVTLLRPSRPTGGYLDPGNSARQGARALADLLAQRGQPVIRADSAAAAARDAAARPATLVVTSPYLLGQAQLRALAATPADLLVAEPDGALLRALGGRVMVAGAAPGARSTPDCSLGAAVAAGEARLGGVLLRPVRGAAWRCYPVHGLPSLVRYAAGGRTVTLLGSGEPLTNQYLARGGNAALALNLLRGAAGVIWLVPRQPAVAAAGPESLPQEIPRPAYLVAAQLFVAAAVTAAWRARRLGPLVAEPLPVVIRAAETVEGHGRLYRSRRARDRAAAALRTAARDRITARLALPPGLDPGAACTAIATRAGRDPAGVRAVLFGPAPRDDAALVALGQDLDRLEREVRTL